MNIIKTKGNDNGNVAQLQQPGWCRLCICANASADWAGAFLWKKGRKDAVPVTARNGLLGWKGQMEAGLSGLPKNAHTVPVVGPPMA